MDNPHFYQFFEVFLIHKWSKFSLAMLHYRVNQWIMIRRFWMGQLLGRHAHIHLVVSNITGLWLFIYWEESSKLTNSIIFQMGRYTPTSHWWQVYLCFFWIRLVRQSRVETTHGALAPVKKTSTMGVHHEAHSRGVWAVWALGGSLELLETWQLEFKFPAVDRKTTPKMDINMDFFHWKDRFPGNLDGFHESVVHFFRTTAESGYRSARTHQNTANKNQHWTEAKAKGSPSAPKNSGLKWLFTPINSGFFWGLNLYCWRRIRRMNRRIPGTSRNLHSDRRRLGDMWMVRLPLWHPPKV